MISFSSRAAGEEIMDDLNCQGQVVEQTLRELDFINHWLGGNAVTLSALQASWREIPADQELTILDLGCGSGELLRIISRKAILANRKVRLIGIDANPHIVEYARKHSADYPNIRFEAMDIFSENFKQLSCDIVLATLFVHHFSDAQLSSFLFQLKSQVRRAIIINDIHRHPLAFYSIQWLTRWFSRSTMVKYDAPLSVLRAFHKSELQDILRKAQITRFKLSWRWAFRWQVVIRL